MNLKRAIYALVMGALIISFSGVWVKLSHTPPSVSGFYRVFFGWLFLIFFCLIKKELYQWHEKQNFLAVVCGLLFALDLWAWHSSIAYIGPGLATILGNCQVFVLSVTGFLVFKERVHSAFILSVPLAFTGLFLMIGIDMEHIGDQQIKGIFFGILAAVFYSMFLLLLRKLQAEDKSFSLFYYLMAISFSASIFLGVFAIASGQSLAIPDRSALFSLICLGLFSQTVGGVMITNSLPKVRASLAGLILLLQPAFSFVWDVIFFKRVTGIAGWTGVILVLAAIYWGMGKKTESLK